tara:strand:- start:1147 stop:1782 length:636 start_codon:yes stop_codon:yes gene_type:complete
MHNNIKNDVLCLTTAELNNSLREVKDYLDFNMIFSHDFKKDLTLSKFNAVIVDQNILDQDVKKLLDTREDVVKVLLAGNEQKSDCFFNKIINRPFEIVELNKIVLGLIIGHKFNKNSSVKIKNYILDKNEKKLKKNGLFIFVTEKEIKLLELLLVSNEPISKKNILEKVWLYSAEADTHTVETHIYRLRKKIYEKFNDDNLIANIKEGYLI